jgi:hypothetical protein
VSGVSFFALFDGGPAFAQATGQVQVTSGASGGARLDSLQQLLLSPPEPRLNLFAVGEYQHEDFDGYTEDAVLFDPTGVFASVPVDNGVIVPDFDVTSGSASFGADYLFDNGLLIGASFDYNHSDFDFDDPSPASVQRALINAPPTDPTDFVQQGGFGSPLDRDFNEYGLTLAAGYVLDPWTFLLAASYSYRDIETKRREFNDAFQFFENEADFNSNNYSIDVGVAYRLDVAKLSIQPQASIGYRREDVDGYTEDPGRQFEDNSGSPVFDGDFEEVKPGDPGFDPDDDTRRRFNDQTIESIPLTLGVLLGYPLGIETTWAGLSNVRGGVSYTHDFEDQKRTVEARSLNFPEFSAKYEEQNRNQDFVTFTGSLEFDLLGLRGALTYEHDQGFDERERADRVQLQLRAAL